MFAIVFQGSNQPILDFVFKEQLYMHILFSYIRFFHLKKLYLIPPLLAAIWFLTALPHHDRQIFPNGMSSLIEGFNDSGTGGNSLLDTFFVSSRGVTIRYTLRDSLLYPYSGFKFSLLSKDSIPVNLSSYDYLLLDISCKKQQSVDFFIHTDLPGRTIASQPLTYRFLYKYLVFLEPRETRKIALSSLETPCWWYYNNRLQDNFFGSESYKRVAEIIVQSGNNNPNNQLFEFTVHQISVHRDLKIRGLLATVFISAWTFIYILFYIGYIRQRPVDKKVVVLYEPLTVGNESDETLDRIVQYIAREYANSELTVQTVATEVGVLPAKITGILQEKRNCSYKQYLNAIRLEEAKRLLLETDRTITEIAYKVGYRSVTHFNRIFKESMGESPSSFRGKDC
jgi:AraC-like DNA-binding protein